jgi:hypothetical protein
MERGKQRKRHDDVSIIWLAMQARGGMGFGPGCRVLVHIRLRLAISRRGRCRFAALWLSIAVEAPRLLFLLCALSLRHRLGCIETTPYLSQGARVRGRKRREKKKRHVLVRRLPRPLDLSRRRAETCWRLLAGGRRPIGTHPPCPWYGSGWLANTWWASRISPCSYGLLVHVWMPKGQF